MDNENYYVEVIDIDGKPYIPYGYLTLAEANKIADDYDKHARAKVATVKQYEVTK